METYRRLYERDSLQEKELSAAAVQPLSPGELLAVLSARRPDEFIYEVGKMIYPANGFNPYPWLSDAAGIHFFTDRDMAIAFGTGYY